MAPFMPSLAGVNTNSAPNIRNRARRSRLIDSGMVSVKEYPLAAATKARAMPVFPLVGSMIRVPFFNVPAFSAVSIIARPMRSFTLESGLKNSSFNRIVACPGGTIRLSFTSGVLNVVSMMFP